MLTPISWLLLLPAQDPAVIRTTAEEVVLDVVVRDKRGRPIKDLTLGEIAVMDNGQKQTVRGFRLVEGGEAIDKGSRTALDPLRQTRLVTLVFERLSPDARRLARQAALDLIKGELGQNVFYSVFTIDSQLFALQNFTRDREGLRKAIERATAGQNQLFDSEAARIRTELDAARSRLANPGAGADRGQAAIDGKLVEVMSSMMRFDQSFAQGESTRLSIFALLGLVRGQFSMPGRKTIVYFSQGMWIPPHLDEPFRAIMSTANRGNVSLYAVDTRGVLVNSQNQAALDQMRRAAQASADDLARDDGRVSVEAIMASDQAEQSSRNNVQLPLRDLAESTGGFLIADTNDLRGPLRQVNEEINAYYEITYSPSIPVYDGSFRKTSVEVTRKDLVLHSRRGYFALPPDIGGRSVLPYELPLLKSLDSRPLPRDIEYRSAAIRFEPTPDGVRTSLVIEVPFAGVQFTEDATKTNYKARISALVMLKDATGEVVQKFSRDLPLAGPVTQIPQIRMGNFVYKEQMNLAPGRYTLETAVVDHEAGKTAARRAALVVPAKRAGVSVSGLTLVRNYQANAPGLDPKDPFQYQGGRITPALSGTIVNVKGAQLSTFFVVYPDPAIPDKPQVVMEYALDGKPVGRGEVPLPAADGTGKIPYVMSAPAENMPPGNYEVRVLVKQGATTAEDRAFVTVAARP
jgi:VWFA-related protein